MPMMSVCLYDDTTLSSGEVHCTRVQQNHPLAPNLTQAASAINIADVRGFSQSKWVEGSSVVCNSLESAEPGDWIVANSPAGDEVGSLN